MANNGNQKLKILHILDILKKYTDEDHPISAAEIAEKLEEREIDAERKSIYRDLHVLQEFGYDVEQEGSRGGYYLDVDAFELPELKLLIDAVSASRFISEKKSRELVAKLEGLGSVYQQKQLHRQVVVANRGKVMDNSILYTIDTIHNAINENHKLSFQYMQWTTKKELVCRHDGKEYVVSPAFLLWDNENYYLVAYDEEHEEIRNYRVDRMRNAWERDEDCNPKCHKVQKENYANKQFSMYTGDECDVGLRIDARLVTTFLDRFGTGISMREDDTGIHVRIHVEVSPQFYGWIAGLGDLVVVESPASVHDDYREYIQKILANY